MKEKAVESMSTLVAAVTHSISERVVCSEATCMCTGNPAVFATLSITTHQKYYSSAVDKLIATVEDNQFESGSSPFQQCKHRKGRDKTCAYQPVGVWEIANKESLYTIEGRGILTTRGTLRCARGGTLSIRTSGDASIKQEEKCSSTPAFGVRRASIPKQAALVECLTQTTSYVSKVEGLTLSNLGKFHCGSLSQDNPRALRIQKGDELLFTAATSEKEASKNICWSVLYAKEGSRELEGGKTGKAVQFCITGDAYQTYSSKHRAFSWQPQKAGIYLIGVAPKPQMGVSKSYEETLYYYLEVVNEATITGVQLSVTPEEELAVGDRVGITLHSDIKLSSKQIEQLLIKVTAKHVHPGNHTAFAFSSKGKHPVKQRGTAIQVFFDCVNVNVYQVEVYKNLVRQTAIPTPYFTVGNSSLLSISPPLESVRIGSRVVFSAVLKDGGSLNPLLVRWRIKVPDSESFQEHFAKDTTMLYPFSKTGDYVIECVYDHFGPKRKSVQHRIRVVANALEEMTILPCTWVDRLKERKYKIRCNDRIKVILGTTIGYQPPTTEPTYVEVQTRDGSSFFTRIIQRTFSSLEKKSTRPRQINTDTAIVWTLSYIKGPKKKVGFGLSIYYETPKPEQSIQPKLRQLHPIDNHTTSGASLEPMSIYPIYTQTGSIVLRSNSAQFDFKFEEVGIYQLNVTLNHTTHSYEIECLE